MQRQRTTGWALFALLVSSSVLATIAYPQQPPPDGFVPMRGPQLPAQRIERKFAEKPNAIKKVALDDLNDVDSNQIPESGGGGAFSWSNLLGMFMHMIFNPGGAAATGPNKSDDLGEGAVATSPWANLISLGLKILSVILGGGGAATSDGIDKVDNGGSPLPGILGAVLNVVVGGRDPDQANMMAKQASEFIQIVVNLLDALKTSFSHRSMAARSLGRKDTVSEAAVAGIAMLKGYVRSLTTEDSKCMAKYVCEANNECSSSTGQQKVLCPLGSYAVSFMLDRSTPSSTFDLLYEAGRRGRSGDNCQQVFLECNEV